MDSNDNRNWAGGRFRDNNDKFDPNKFYMMRGHTLRTVLNCIEVWIEKLRARMMGRMM